jgi:hypothetical protein
MVPPEAEGKFQGPLVAPMQPHASALGIDPNLMVGPVYEPKVSAADSIKAQLSDITEKLHKVTCQVETFLFL